MGHRYQILFEKLDQERRGAFIPFTLLGYPDRRRSLNILFQLARHADALELGIPFSDPIADGPIIQRAAVEALANRVSPQDCLELIAEFRQKEPEIPIGLLVYANLVVAPGIGHFYRQVAESGADSVLIADVPVDEGRPFVEIARAQGIAPIFIAPENASTETLKQVAELGDGYTYVLTRRGVTGAEADVGATVHDQLVRLKQIKAPPPVLGFGIGRPDQVSRGVASGAAGVISGSAVIKRLTEQVNGNASPENLDQWLGKMHAATRGNLVTTG